MRETDTNFDDFRIDNTIPRDETTKDIHSPKRNAKYVSPNEPRKPVNVIPHDIRGKARYYLSEEFSYSEVCRMCGLGMYDDTPHGNREAKKSVDRLLMYG